MKAKEHAAMMREKYRKQWRRKLMDRRRCISREQLYLAVWMYHVQSHNMLRGWLTEQGLFELNEAIAYLCRARKANVKIPPMWEACAWYNYEID